MFEFLYEWIKNIAYFTILATTVIQILPDSDYRRYVRFFLGLILVILLAAPVMRLFKEGEGMGEIFDSRAYQEQMQSIENAASFLDDVREEEYLDPITENPKEAENGREDSEIKGLE